MKKMIKKSVQLRLDELIKYIFDSGIEDKTYGVTVFDNTSEVRISGAGNIKLSGYINKNTTFTVEVEEEITKDTKFTWLVEANNTRIWTRTNASIRDVLDEETKEIRALINGKLELIWESESDERN